MSRQITTKTKILNAAEKLFALSGFAETSMRQITNKAEVNLASVNYHFGSKKDLTIEVLDRYLSQLMPEISDNISTLGEAPKPESVLTCFIQPLLNLENINKGGTICFLRLLGRGYVDVQGHLRKYITETYRQELDHIMSALQSSMPELSEEELFWRVHFSLGTSVFTLAASDALTEIVKADFNNEVTTEQILQRLLPYISSGFAQ